MLFKPLCNTKNSPNKAMEKISFIMFYLLLCYGAVGQIKALKIVNKV